MLSNRETYYALTLTRINVSSVIDRIFSYLDVVSLCRCAQVSKAWNVLALDGSNWQRIDLFDFQRDVEVNREPIAILPANLSAHD